MSNASMSLSTAINITEDRAEVMNRGFAGQIQLVEYTEMLDVVSAGATDLSVGLGGMSSFDVLYIESDGDISIKLGADDNDAIALKALQNSGEVNKCVFLLQTTAISALFVTNPSADNSVKVRFIFGKRP